jgi:putative pyruvate formate lyase activating enzyme
MFSQLGEGVENSIDFLADAMLGLQNKGAHNINLVTPTHYSIQIIQAVKIAKEKGLKIPIVYNTNGYELSEMIDLLNGIVDIYLPDMKYNSEESAVKYSSMPGYVSYNRASVKRMYEQVGELVCEDGIAKRGIIIRHLILPNGLSGTRGIMEFISRELSPNVHMSLMSQYYPVYNASVHPEINRQITKNEYEEAIDAMEQYGLENGWIQDAPSDDDRNTFLGENFNLNI